MWEQLVYTILLLPKDVVQALVHLIPVLLDEPLHSLLMQPLVQRWVLSVDKDLAVGEGQALYRLLVEDDVQRDLLTRLRKREKRMVLHLLPRWPATWVLLHGLAEELEALERDLDVLRPGPSALLDLAVEELQGHLVGCLLGDVENEHAGQHLIENDADCPNVDLVTVPGAAAPVCLDLLGWHHQRRTFERESAIAPGGGLSVAIAAARVLELSRVAQVRNLDNKDLVLEINSIVRHSLCVRSVWEVH